MYRYSWSPRVTIKRAVLATRVRVTIRWSPVNPIDQFVKITTLCRRLPCLLGQHQGMIEVRGREMALRCEQCGWKSPGWRVGLGENADESNQPQFLRAAAILMQKPAKHPIGKTGERSL